MLAAVGHATLVALVLVASLRQPAIRLKVAEIVPIPLGEESGTLSPGQSRLGTTKPQLIQKPGPIAPVHRLPDLGGRTSAPRAERAVGGTGEDVGGVSIGSGVTLGDPFGSAPHSWYLVGVQSKIWSVWVAQLRPESPNAPVVEFTIRQDGSLGPVDILQSSGLAVIDMAAKRAIYSAGPFAALPKDLGRDEMRVRAIFKAGS